MQPLQFLRNHPVALAVVLGVGFAAWLAFDAVRQPNGSTTQLSTSDSSIPNPEGMEVRARRLLPLDPMDPSTQVRNAIHPGVVTSDLLPRLQPGMARVEVEGLIGTPPAQLVYPVSNVDGRLIYRASYLANFEPPPPAPVGVPLPVPPVRTMIGLEFDAERPGHPLIKVHVPDPMS